MGMPGGLEHDRPINAVGFQDILGDDVLGRRPESFKQLTIRIAQGGDIV